MILRTYSITNDTTNDLGLISVPQALSACISRSEYTDYMISYVNHM